MANTFKTDLSESTIDFKNIVMPILRDLLNGGEFDVVEGIAIDELAKKLDLYAGIDVFYTSPNFGMMGIASRIQKDGNNWRTFTIRKSRDSGTRTEYEKRVYARKHDYLNPHLTMQAYLDRDRTTCLGLAVTRTNYILDCIAMGFYKENKTGWDKYGQASFYVVRWDDMRKNGFKVVEYKKPLVRASGA